MITVIIPCYNQGVYLEATLTSVLNQTYTEWECLIINDGSTDNTENIALAWVENDKRFKYFYKENGGLSSARNLGLDKASGVFIQFLDSDDFLESSKLKKSYECAKMQGHNLVICDFKRFRKNLDKLKKAFCVLRNQNFNFDSILLDWDIEYTIPIHCGFFEAEMIGAIRFDERLKAKEDWKFWLDFFHKNPNVGFIDEVLAFYRVHKKGMTKNHLHMENNLKVAYNVIYNELGVDKRAIFFDRLVKEKIYSQKEFRLYKDNIFYRKWFYKFKSFFA